MKALGTLAATAVLAATVGTTALGERAASPTVPQMVGQLLLVRMHGQSPSPAFLHRVKTGEVGGVVLYSDNFGAAGPKRLVERLQAAAKAGHQPPLIIAIDQEGGTVKRLPGAPSLAPPEMHSATIAEAQGLATARNLKAAGVNVDLAPVLDVGHGGFITSRAFGTTAQTAAARGAAFAAGLSRGGILATAKHFPGLGDAELSTDANVATVTATAAQLRADWLPFRHAITGGIPLVMMSTAVYPALGSKWPAALSPNEVSALRRLGFKGVIVTDALQTPAVHKFTTTANAAVQAVAAGDDLVLAGGTTGAQADTDKASVSAFNALVQAGHTGRVKLERLRDAYQRVLTLKRRLSYRVS